MQKERLRIAIVTSGFLPVIDGVTVTLNERLKRLSAWGHECLLLAPDYSPISTIYPGWKEYVGAIRPGLTVYPYASKSFFGMPWERNPKLFGWKKAHAKLAAFAPDVIVIEEPERLWTGILRCAGLALKRKAGIPTVAFYHTNFVDYVSDYAPFAWMAKPAQFVLGRGIAGVYRSYDATLVASNTALDRVKALGITNALAGPFLGVDTSCFSPAMRDRAAFGMRFGLSLKDDTTVLGCVGRLTPDKGWEFLVKGLLQVARGSFGANVVLVVAGDGEVRATAEKQLHGHFAKVHFLGRVVPNEMPLLMAGIDVLVGASLHETLGLTILEALASGTPVLAPRVPSSVEFIADGITGLLYVPGDVGDFVAKLETLIAHPDERRRLGAAGPAAARSRDWDAAARSWLDALSEIATPTRGVSKP